MWNMTYCRKDTSQEKRNSRQHGTKKRLTGSATSLWHVDFPHDIDVHVAEESIVDLAGCFNIGQSTDGESKRPGLESRCIPQSFSASLLQFCGCFEKVEDAFEKFDITSYLRGGLGKQSLATQWRLSDNLGHPSDDSANSIMQNNFCDDHIGRKIKQEVKLDCGWPGCTIPVLACGKPRQAAFRRDVFPKNKCCSPKYREKQ